MIDNDYAIHRNLLRYMGTAEGGNYRTILNTMAGALIFIIVLASVTLIYNAFSISVSERTKQFGLLKSIGATKKQIRHSVCFEALCLCVIGIPIGILSGSCWNWSHTAFCRQDHWSIFEQYQRCKSDTCDKPHCAASFRNHCSDHGSYLGIDPCQKSSTTYCYRRTPRKSRHSYSKPQDPQPKMDLSGIWL